MNLLFDTCTLLGHGASHGSSAGGCKGCCAIRATGLRRARRISVGKYMNFTRAESSTDTGGGLFAGR